MHPALNTITVHTLCTLLTFSILTGLFANKGQKALIVYNKNACVLLRMICLGRKPLSRRAWLEE